MDEIIKTQVLDAIKNNYYVAYGTTWTGGSAWHTPIRIDDDKIVMLWGDCGDPDNPNDLSYWTEEEWKDRATAFRLCEKVGLWDFCPVNRPYTEQIKAAYHNPTATGMHLYYALERIKELEELLKL